MMYGRDTCSAQARLRFGLRAPLLIAFALVWGQACSGAIKMSTGTEESDQSGRSPGGGASGTDDPSGSDTQDPSTPNSGSSANGGSGSGNSGGSGDSGDSGGSGDPGNPGGGGVVDTSALLPQDRATPWNPGLNSIGGIPTRDTVCTTVAAGSGRSAIQSAIDGCPDDQVVMLAEGTFNIGEPIEAKSNVTIRGAGPGKTILKGSGNPIIIAGTRWYKYVDPRNFSANATRGSDSVEVDDASGLQVGEIVNVSEQYDAELTRYMHDAQRTSSDYLGWGECRCLRPDCHEDRGAGCDAQNSAQAAINHSRPIGQVMEITSISGNTLTFSTPFRFGYRTARGARLSRFGGTDWNPVGKPTTKVGVEDLTVTDGGGGDDEGPISFLGASYSWVKNIESTRSSAVAVLFKGSFRCVLRDSYIHSTVNPNPGGGGYGIGVDSYAADNLIENNISWNFNKVMVMRSSGGGNVIAYNYMQDGWGEGYTNQPETGLNASHMATSHYELFEGNEAHNFSNDTTWGNTIYITALRNHLTGLRISAPPLQLLDVGNRRAIDVNEANKWFTFIGNVLGFENMPLNASMPGGNSGQKRFEYEPTQGNYSYTDTANMWQLVNADQAALSTLLRLGNFDWVTKTQKWPGMGGIGAPDNPPDPLPEIPNSFYLTSKPAFFGSNPWPWVNPSTGETSTLPAKARFNEIHGL